MNFICRYVFIKKIHKAQNNKIKYLSRTYYFIDTKILFKKIFQRYLFLLNMREDT